MVARSAALKYESVPIQCTAEPSKRAAFPAPEPVAMYLRRRRSQFGQQHARTRDTTNYLCHGFFCSCASRREAEAVTAVVGTHDMFTGVSAAVCMVSVSLAKQVYCAAAASYGSLAHTGISTVGSAPS